MEDERQKAETSLKSLPDLLQEICRLWPPGVVSVSAKLGKHLDELKDGFHLFLNLPCSMRKEYERKAGEVVVNSGLIAMLCEKATPWLEDKQADDVNSGLIAMLCEKATPWLEDKQAVMWALHVCTLGTEILLKKGVDLHQLLPLLVNLLKESFFDHVAGALQQGGDNTLTVSLGVLCGLAYVQENRQHLRVLPNIHSVLKTYSTSKNLRIYNYAVTTMTLLETERRADMSSPNHDMVKFLLGQLKALEREGFDPYCLKLSGVFEAVCNLTLNHGNRELMVQEGVLPYLEKSLVKSVSKNSCKERTSCTNIVRTLHNLACAKRIKAEIMKHKQLQDSLVSISFDQSHSHRPDCYKYAKCALSNLGRNPQDMQNDGPRRTGSLNTAAPYNHMISETEKYRHQIPVPAPQRMNSSDGGLTNSIPSPSAVNFQRMPSPGSHLPRGTQPGSMAYNGSTYSIQSENMTGFQTPGMPLPMLPGSLNSSINFMPHGSMPNSSQTNHVPPLVSPFHRPPFRMPHNVPSSGPMNSFSGMSHGSSSNNVQLGNVPPFTTPGHLPPARMPFNMLPDGGMNGNPYGSMTNTVRPCAVPPAGAHGNFPPARMNCTVPNSDLINCVPPGGMQTNTQRGYVPHLPPGGMSSDCPARNTTGNLPEGSRSNDLQTDSFLNSMNRTLDMQNYMQPGNVHYGNTPSSGTPGSMQNNHGGLMTNMYCTPSFGVTGGAPGLGMMGHEPNSTILPDPRNAPKSISGSIRPEEDTINVGSSQVGPCTQIDPNSHSTVPMDSDMDDEQLSTNDSSIRPTPSLPVISRTESLSRSSVITTAPFSGNTAVSASRSATAKSSSTVTVLQGSLSPGPISTAGNSSSHAPPAISMSTTGGGLPSSSTFAKPSTPIVPGSGPDFSVLSPCETLNSSKPQLPSYHESNLCTPCPASVNSESASTPRLPAQQHIPSPESRGSFSPSQPSPGHGHGVPTSEHAQERLSAPPSPSHPGLPFAMNHEGSSLYKPGEQINNCMKTDAGKAQTCRFIFKADGKPAVREQINKCMKTDAGKAQTCRIIFKADGKPAVLLSNPESESSGKAKHPAQRTVSSTKSSNKRAKLLPKLETVSSDGANYLPQTGASSSKSKKKRTKLSSNPVSGSSSRDTRIDSDMKTEALKTTTVTPLNTTILKAEGKRQRHYRKPKGGVSRPFKVSPSHAGGKLNQFQKSAQNSQPPFKVSRDGPCRDEVPSNPCKSPQQSSDTEQQNCTKKRHTCPCCPKDFISRGDLKAHLMQEKHFKCKKCKECEKRFSYKKTLAKHVRDKHDPEKESSYKCVVCDKEFGCERYMKEHEKVHGEFAHERYTCRNCDKGFPYRSVFNKHIKFCR